MNDRDERLTSTSPELAGDGNFLAMPWRRRVIQICPHDTLQVEERNGVLVHTNTGQSSCNPRNPASPYKAENPRTVIK